jgi:hypothetical protein
MHRIKKKLKFVNTIKKKKYNNVNNLKREIIYYVKREKEKIKIKKKRKEKELILIN